MKVLITGSRDWDDRNLLAMRMKVEEVVEWCQMQGHTIIVGDATGVDEYVRSIAYGYDVTVYGAYGRIRNRDYRDDGTPEIYEITDGTYPERDVVMAEACDMCVAIWNGTSRGTKITFKAAQRLGKRTIIRTFPKAS